MDFTIGLKKRELDRAAALQARIELQGISLYKSEAEGAGPPVSSVEPVRLNADLDSGVEHRDPTGVDFAVTLRVACDQPLTFHIEATFLARYRFADQAKRASRTELDAFRKSHAVLAVWPYMREFVQAIAARMGFPTEPLPMLRLVLRKA
jgi:hypothetical protein